MHIHQEFFESLLRELSQCSSGEGVESVLATSNIDPSRGLTVDKATYILLPPAGTLSDEADFEVVRELSFISIDNGNTWRAEVRVSFHISYVAFTYSNVVTQ
ncbi:hypothetical protein EON65_39175 [archaeon]|nr:MAG: hypothetical protein EON65_39175 [archaeon]